MHSLTVLAHLPAFFFSYRKTCHIYRKTILDTKYVFHVFCTSYVQNMFCSDMYLVGYT
jgi:hypothetical protein